jgi:hypothetical protein
VNVEPTTTPARATRLRRGALLVYGLFALALIPWTTHLTASLPNRHEAAHWDVLWAGFDIGLILAGAATAIAALRRSRLLTITASITGTLLLCDSWFDVLTSQPGSERLWAVGEAVFAEIPLALFSFWIAHDAENVCAAAQRCVESRRARRTANPSVTEPGDTGAGA